MDQQRGKAVLVEFWDFCRVNSLRTLPYLKAWHERYADARVAGHRRAHRRVPARARRARTCAARSSGSRSRGRCDRHRARGVGRLRQPGLAGALPVGPRQELHSLHYGEGAYVETELEIQALLGRRARAAGAGAAEDAPGRADRPADARTSRAPTPARTRRAACGRSSRAPASLRVNGRVIEVTEPGCVALVAHGRHTAGEL